MKKTLIIIISFALTFFSCTTTKYVSASPDVLSKYKIGYIVNPLEYSGSASLGSMDIEIFQLLQKSSLEMIGEGEVDKLSDAQKDTLLAIKYGVSTSLIESVVTISFFDYRTKRPVLNCTGASAWGIPAMDIPPAKKKALGEMKKAFGIK